MISAKIKMRQPRERLYGSPVSAANSGPDSTFEQFLAM